MVDEERWKDRFRAARVSLPSWARDAPHRCLYRSNATGTLELYVWDRETGTQRQLTDRPNGTYIGGVEPSGEQVWWFADTDGDEFGVWMRQPYLGGPDRPAVAALEPSYPAGLALGSSGLAVIGRSTEGGTTIHLCPAAMPASASAGEVLDPTSPGEPLTLYTHREDAHVAGLSRDEKLVAIDHSEHGDSRHMALRVIRLNGETVGELWDGPGKGLSGIGFAPVPGDQRLLVEHERRGKPEPLVWDLSTGAQREIELDLPGEIGADWYPDGSALLISHSYHARDELYRYDLTSGELARIDTPPGVIGAARARPDGTVEFSWSSSASPPVVRSTIRRAVVLRAPRAGRAILGAGRGRVGERTRRPVHALVPKPTGAGPVPRRLRDPWRAHGPRRRLVRRRRGGLGRLRVRGGAGQLSRLAPATARSGVTRSRAVPA